jgi:ATP-dependent Clp protease ATP-binding subunit ClpA
VFDRYSEEARQVVVLAQEEARELRHNYIGTEHLLLGLLRLPRDSVVGQVLAGLELSTDGARARLRDLVPEGEEVTSGQIPFTPRAKKTLELSLHEALSHGANDVGPEHMVLGLARLDQDGVAVGLLRMLGVTQDQLREAMVEALPTPRSRPIPRSILRRAKRTEVHHLPIEIDVSDEARRLLMSAGARALDDGRTLITIADIEAALRRRGDAEDPPPQSATG